MRKNYIDTSDFTKAELLDMAYLGILIKKNLKNAFRKYKATDKGGAPLLGLKGLVVKIHGNCKNQEVSSAIAQCRNFIKNDVTNKIVSAFEEVK